MRFQRAAVVLTLGFGAVNAVGMAHQGLEGGTVGGAPLRLLHPADAAASRPDFFAFRVRLQAAVARRDLDAVLAAVVPEIRNSFGDDDGIEGFMRLWTPRGPGSRLWEELATVLALGGTFEDDGQFIAPYVFSRWPSELDAFEHVALVAPEVALRAAPRADARVLGTASFAVLPLPPPGAGGNVEGWTAVRLEDGRIGYVPSELVRSPIDYRAAFELREGAWRMVMFLAGD